MSYAERSITRSWSVSEMGVVGRSSSRRRLVEMSMQFTSALLVNGGDGIGVSDSSMGGGPAGVGAWRGESGVGWFCGVAVYLC